MHLTQQGSQVESRLIDDPALRYTDEPNDPLAGQYRDWSDAAYEGWPPLIEQLHQADD